MAHRQFCYLFFPIFFLAGCFPKGSIQKQPAGEEGEVIVYLQPMPQEANKLRFTISEISVIQDDGSDVSLSVYIHQVKVAEHLWIQKRLASGFLLAGSYTGISITIKEAFVQGDEGESALLIPEEPIPVASPFKLAQRQASTLFLSFYPSENITNDIVFTPRFSIAPKRPELINLIGYVTNSYSNSISVFNKKAMEVVDTIATGREPRGMVLDQERRRAYVAVSGDDAVEVIDLSKGKIFGRLRLHFQDQPTDLALTPDGETLVSVNRGSNTVSIIDARSLFEMTRITVGQGPASAAINPSGLKAFIMNSGSNTVSVVDLTQKQLSGTVTVEGAPLRGSFNSDGDELYVISEDSPYLTVIDPSRLVVKEKIAIGMGAVSIKVDTQTDLVLVGKSVGGEILVIDPFALMPIDAISVEGHAAYLAIDDEENRLFVVAPDNKTVQKINLTSKKTIAKIDVCVDPYAMVLMGQR